jgi:uncharacterized protein with von Willebrand factor type A (vWA) domain
MKKAITAGVLLLFLAAMGVSQERATPVGSASADGWNVLPEIKEARDAAERNPNSTELLQKLVRLYGEPLDEEQKQARLKELRELLQGWAAKHPESGALQLALADTYRPGNECEQHLLKAVKLTPKLTEAYDRLISLAELSAQDAKAAEYAKRAYESDPKDARFKKYAMRLAESDPAAHRKLLEGVIANHAATPLGAWATLSLALKEDPQKRM